ncbi:hypothetical protein SELMODRAFT_448587 [Selaginella moellendorffii]|uniref:RING-type domain-containing protein n=1 Tax=Selaginella moellendorffii TaxID=88036 RepID=D8T8C1_SELML|nr:probable E3 ubiquitin-protein ligase ATL44 [Selaginella moellendorffii]EFJ07114.1 hypothetical protein SELMODRAFT_448587 [Selaginella moellendorffii]|eukprot:XP_024521356.1 probable E3 ubiquitin-protein ligase ATL44 [Selaginella moellendorffii]
MALKKKPGPLPPRDVHDHDRLFPPLPGRPQPQQPQHRPQQPQPQPWRPRGGETVYKTAVFLGSMIVVAILLVILICMARWDSIVRLVPAFSSTDLRRWMRRRRSRRNSDFPREPRDLDLEASSEDFTMSNSLSKKNRSSNRRAVEALPVVNYSAANLKDNLELGCLVGTECTICLCEFTDGDRVRILPDCYHGFHVECVDVWLIAHASCPSCRRSLHAPSRLEDQQQQQQQQEHQSLSSSSSSSQTTSI